MSSVLFPISPHSRAERAHGGRPWRNFACRSFLQQPNLHAHRGGYSAKNLACRSKIRHNDRRSSNRNTGKKSEFFVGTRRDALLQLINNILPLDYHIPLHPFRIPVELRIRIETNRLPHDFKKRNVRLRITHPYRMRKGQTPFLDRALQNGRLIEYEVRVDDLAGKTLLRPDFIDRPVCFVEPEPRTEFIQHGLRRM